MNIEPDVSSDDIRRKNGLASEEAARLRREYGPNVIEEKKPSVISRLAGFIATPMSFMFAAAGGLSLWSGDSTNAAIVGVLFVANIGIGAWHEMKADTAVEKLKQKLAVMVKVLRDGEWKSLPSAELVPGDTIELSSGDLVPADARFIAAKNVSVNDAAITGESLPKERRVGDGSYSGAFVATGIGTAVVTATGSKTYFGKTLSLVDTTRKHSQLEKDILSISRFLSIVSVSIAVLLTAVFLLRHQSIVSIATLDVSMLIAGIPVALPTVMTLIISVGVLELSRRSAIVRRLSALEDLADVDLLLSDKTGTLTENNIVVAKTVLLDETIGDREMWSLALAASPRPKSSPLDLAIEAKARELKMVPAKVEDFIPGDSERKHTTAFVKDKGVLRAVAFGAPQTIRGLSSMSPDELASYDAAVAAAAREGFRVLSLSRAPGEKEEAMQPIALFFLADAVRPDAKETVDFMHSHGIDIKMVTGDGRDVAAHVAGELGLLGEIVPRDLIERDPAAVKSRFNSIAGFAEVLPKDKYDIVTMARGLMPRKVVAVTGDGINDVPPAKAADVSFAVANAVDALKGTADIVLTAPGISVVKDAIIEARKIFARLYNYSLYRISESFRLIVTIAVIGILFGAYPLTPIQIILIALLNDVPIISLAFDRVAVSQTPSVMDPKRRFALSTLFGLTGIANSMIMLWIAMVFLHLPWAVIQTLFFLKLTVSGHMLVYVAHTEKPWFRFLPSKHVIWATLLTQIAATLIAYFGIFTAPLSPALIGFIWVWSFLWMQVSEAAKHVLPSKRTA